MKHLMTALCMGMSAAVFAQPASGAGNYAQQQAYEEMRRVSGQVDVIQNNLEDLQRKVNRLESGNGGSERELRNEIEALKSSVADLKRQMANQREEIVKDLSSRMAKMQRDMTPPPAPKPAVTKKTVVVEAHDEYVVEKGDTLSIIAQALNTTVPKIKEMNNLKNDNLRVGQKLKVPAN